MAENTHITFIIPVYRGGNPEKTLHSLASQTDRGFSVLLADDALPEGLASVAAEFEDALNIRCIRFDTALGGVSRSRNLFRCLSLETGETYVCFLSPDILLPPRAVRRMRKTMAAHPEYAVYHWNTELVDADLTPVEKFRRYGASLPADRLFGKLFVKGFPSPLGSFVFRRDVLVSKGVFDEALYQSDLQNVFACAAEKGVRTVRWTRIRQLVPAGIPEPSEPEILSRLAFFRWSETFFGEDYPLSVGDRLDLFAATAASLFPNYTEDEVKEQFMRFAACQGAIRKIKASLALRSALRDRTAWLKGKN